MAECGLWVLNTVCCTTALAVGLFGVNGHAGSGEGFAVASAAERAPAIVAACREAAAFCAVAAGAGGRGLVPRMQRALQPGSRLLAAMDMRSDDAQVRKCRDAASW